MSRWVLHWSEDAVDPVDHYEVGAEEDMRRLVARLVADSMWAHDKAGLPVCSVITDAEAFLRKTSA